MLGISRQAYYKWLVESGKKKEMQTNLVKEVIQARNRWGEVHVRACVRRYSHSGYVSVLPL